jgi:hypothetical protein
MNPAYNGFIYLTTNLLNGRWYIGSCWCKNMDRAGYLGSGKLLTQAIAKYGRENFQREILYYYDVFVLCVMYGTAAIGWSLVLGMPRVAAVYLSVSNEAKVQAMMREQRRLIEEWGEGVTEMPPPRKSAATSAKPA